MWSSRSNELSGAATKARERERERQREDKSEIRRKEPGGAGSRNETDYDGGGMEVDLLHRELLKNP